jgi:hypothetical protein
MLSVGTPEGSPAMPTYGSGPVAGNTGVLTRENESGDATGCTWHQKDVATFTLYNHDKFALAVREDRSMFSAMCVPVPPDCTSSWTWGIEKP